jgi:hypothetical protein
MLSRNLQTARLFTCTGAAETKLRFFLRAHAGKRLSQEIHGEFKSEAQIGALRRELHSWTERLNAGSHSGLRTIGTTLPKGEAARPERVAPQIKFSVG